MDEDGYKILIKKSIIVITVVISFLVLGTFVFNDKPIKSYYLVHSYGNFRIYADVDYWPDHIAVKTMDLQTALDVCDRLNGKSKILIAPNIPTRNLDNVVYEIDNLGVKR